MTFDLPEQLLSSQIITHHFVALQWTTAWIIFVISTQRSEAAGEKAATNRPHKQQWCQVMMLPFRKTGSLLCNVYRDTIFICTEDTKRKLWGVKTIMSIFSFLL